MAEDIMFSVGVDTGSTAKDMQKVDKTFKEIDSNLKGIEKQAKKTFSGDGFQKVNKEIKKTAAVTVDVRQKLRELQNRMAEIGDVGSAEFQKLAKEAGMYKDQMNNANAAIKSMSADFPKLQILGQGLTALGGAAQGVTAGMALLGGENEAVTQSIQKMMAIQSLMNAVQAVSNTLSDESAIGLQIRTTLTKIKTANDLKAAASTGALTVAQKGLTVATWLGNGAMKALNVVIGMNPIFLLVAVIAAVVAGFMLFSESAETAEEANDKLNASIDRQNRAFERQQANLKKNAENRLRDLKLANASEEELSKETFRRLEEEEQARKDELSQLEKNLKKKDRLRKRAHKDEEGELAKSIRSEMNADTKRIQELTRNAGDFSRSKQEEIKRFSEWQDGEAQKELDKEESRRKESASRWKKAQEEKRRQEEEDARKADELQKLMTDLSIANIEDENVRAIAEIGVKHQRERDALREKYGVNTELEIALKTKQDTELREAQFKLDETARLADEATAAADLEKANEDNRIGLEAKLLQMQGNFEAEQEVKLAIAEQERAALLMNDELTANQRLLIEEKYNEAVRNLNKERKDNEVKTNEALISSRQDLLGAVAGVFGQLAGLAREGSSAAKALALTEIGINTAVGFVNGLRIAQESAVAAGPGAAFAFPIFYATQIGAVLAAASKAKAILGSGPSVSAPSATGQTGGGASSASSPTAFGIPENNETNPNDIMTNTVLLVDSVTKIQGDSAQVQAISTVG